MFSISIMSIISRLVVLSRSFPCFLDGDGVACLGRRRSLAAMDRLLPPVATSTAEEIKAGFLIKSCRVFSHIP